MLTLKKKRQPVILPGKWVYSEIAKELLFRTCKLRHATGKSEDTRRRWAFIRFLGRNWRGLWWVFIGCRRWAACCWWVRRKSFLRLRSVSCGEWYMGESAPFRASWFHFKWSFLYFLTWNKNLPYEKNQSKETNSQELEYWDDPHIGVSRDDFKITIINTLSKTSWLTVKITRGSSSTDN